MHRIPKIQKQKALSILGQVNINIEKCDYQQYLGCRSEYYRVTDKTARFVPLMDIVVTPVFRNLYRYELTLNNKKYSHLVRDRAVFHTPGADDMLEIYNMLQVRYLAQQSRRK